LFKNVVLVLKEEPEESKELEVELELEEGLTVEVNCKEGYG
jgi:hypothetical protein